jgi:coproporphyrinogen III oxidase
VPRAGYQRDVHRTRSNSVGSTHAIALVEGLQDRFHVGLERLAAAFGPATAFTAIEWARDEGRHGGGMRWAASETPVFQRVAINVSHVHYADEPDKRLESATALSTIIHPQHPHAPSVHIHVSWTENKDGSGYWRVMADLNPAIADPAARDRFAGALRAASGEWYEHAAAQGDRYFYIPALGRHRGVTHFYLEAHHGGDAAADRELARRVGEAAIDTYLELLADALTHASAPTPEDRAAQLAYHTLYLFQVLTLDRGTTSGLLVHDQNDVGIMGSLPAYVDRELLAAWEATTPAVQRPLVRGIVEVLAQGIPAPADAGPSRDAWLPTRPSHVDEHVRAELAKVLRRHYQAYPQAVDALASGDVLPPTVANHQS